LPIVSWGSIIHGLATAAVIAIGIPPPCRAANSCIRECRKRAESTPTGCASGGTGVGTIAVISERRFMDALAEKTVEVSYKIRRVSLPAVPITAHFVPAGDPPRGIKTRAIGTEQQGRHHARIEWRLTKPAFVTCDDLRQIQVLARQSDDELRQMVRRHIIDNRRRQELCLINCPRTKMSAHASKGIRFVPKMPPLLGHAPS
jgi:hypothetical protein